MKSVMVPKHGWVNVRSGDHYDVFVGRPTRFGNPFVASFYCTRDEAIGKFVQYMRRNPHLWGPILAELPGKTLGCYCWPLDCHARILWQMANLGPEDWWISHEKWMEKILSKK